MDKFYITQHDLQPYFRFKVSNANDLSGATVVCTMTDRADGITKVIDRQTAGCVITDGVNKEIEYRWQAGDTDNVGQFNIEFEITPVMGGKFTVPSYPKEQLIIITHDLDGV